MFRRLSLFTLLTTLATGPVLADQAVFDVVGPFEIKAADPVLSGDIFLKMDVAETLVGADPSGHLIPGLADRWSVSEDRLVWRFHIRPGVLFHDGTPLSAEAAVKALSLARSKGGLLAKAPITAIKAEAEDVVVTLSAPFSSLPAFLAEYRSLIYAPAAYAPEGTVKAVIGTGAFKVTTLEPPGKLEAVRFDAYWGGPAKLAQVRYQAASRAETRALMAESGDADLAVALDPASVSRLRQVERVRVESVALPRILILKMNAALPFFDTPEERRALSLAIDRAGLAQGVLRYPAAATQMFPPALAGWHDPSLAPLSYDPEAARAAFAAAGWTPGPDGILQNNGQRFAVDLLTFPDRPELPLAAAVLEQLFREVGIDVTINATNASEIPARHAAGTLQLAVFARNFALVPDPVGTLMQDYAPTGDWGAMGWSSPALTALVGKMAAEGGSDHDKAQVAAIFQAELPVLPIAWYQLTLAVSRSATGIVADPYERTFGLKTADFVR